MPSSCIDVSYFFSNIFKIRENASYLKVEIVTHQRGMTEQSSRCLLPMDAKALNKKSENVKLSATSMTPYDPIFVIIGCFKTQLFPQKPWTCAIFLWEYCNRFFTTYIFQTYSKYGKMHLKGWNCYIPERNDWTELALLAANGRKSLGSKIRKRQIVGNVDDNLRPDFRHHRLH